jgi:hypothetical protein
MALESLEYRFVLTDFTYRDSTGRPHFFEAGRSCPMLQAVAYAATKCGLASKGQPQGWTPPDVLFSPIMTLAEDEVAKARAELWALKRYAPGNEQSAPDWGNAKLSQTPR